MRSSMLLSVVVALGCSVQAYINGEEHVDKFDSLPLSGYSAGLLFTDGLNDDGPESGGLEYSPAGYIYSRDYFYYQNHGITRYSVVAGGIIPHSTPIAVFLEQPRNGRITAVRRSPDFTSQCTKLKSTYVACSLFTRDIYYGLNLKIPNIPIGCRVTFKGYNKAGKSIGVKNYDFMPDLIRPPNKAYEALAAGNIFGFIENTPLTSDMKLMQLDFPPGTTWDVSANALPLPVALPGGLPPNITTILRDTVYDVYSEIIVLHLDDVTYTVVGGDC